MKISTTETKVMAFPEKELVRTKIVINDQIIDQVSHWLILAMINIMIQILSWVSSRRYVEKLIVFLERKHVLRQNLSLTMLWRLLLPYRSELWTISKNNKVKFRTCTNLDHMKK